MTDIAALVKRLDRKDAFSVGAFVGGAFMLWFLLAGNHVSSLMLNYRYTAAKDENYVARQYLEGTRCVRWVSEEAGKDDFTFCRTACESKYSREGQMAISACKAGVLMASDFVSKAALIRAKADAP